MCSDKSVCHDLTKPTSTHITVEDTENMLNLIAFSM